MKHVLSKLVQYIRHTYLSHWIILGIDVFIAMACSLGAYVCIYYITDTRLSGAALSLIVSISGVSVILGSFLFNTYRNIIRYSKAKDLWRVTGCAFFKIVSLLCVLFFMELYDFGKLNIVLVIFDGMLTLIAMVGIRILMIVTYEYLLEIDRKTRMRLLIYGFDDKSVSLEARLHSSTSYKVVGFFTYNSSNKSKSLVGLPIYSSENEKGFGELVSRKKIQGLLFPRFDAVRNEDDRLLKYCKTCKIKTLIAPMISEADEDGKFHQAIRSIKIEDLLGREEINISMQEVVEEFQNKVVLVTGAAGSIGSELCRQLARIGVKKLLLLDSAETPLHNTLLEFETKFPTLDFVPIIGDVRVKQRLRMVFEQYRPQIVIHAAAYKHVPLMESNPCEAVLVNVAGTCHLADISLEYGVEKMIMISTDKAVNPTNVMGASKRLAEVYVQSLGGAVKEGKVKGVTRFITTRFGNVLGSNGSVVLRFKEQIENGGPLTVTHPEIIRYFMTIPEACRLVLEAATMGNGDDIFVFDMGKQMKIVDLANKMIELAGYRPGEDIKIKYTGLRPGEKLYEEMLSCEENTIPTSNEKIKIAKVRRYEYDSVLETYRKFEKLARDVDVMSTVSLMKEVLPEFISQNSPSFEALDLNLVEEESVNG